MSTSSLGSAARTPATTGAAVGVPLLLALALLATIAPIATDLYLPGFPAMADDLGASVSGIQLTLTTFLVGMALGQLVVGPLSDRYGRRGPLVVSAAVCVLASAVCAVTPSLAVLVAARLVQGFAGAGGMVIGRAVIADLVTGRTAARAFTLMMTVGGVAPVLAPLVGGLLAEPVGWRGMLWVVTALAAVMLAVVLVAVPETRPASLRGRGDGPSYAEGLRAVLSSRGYWVSTAVFALAFGMMMAYISASPFLYQSVLGLSEVGYGVAFGVNATGLVLSGAVAARLASTVAPQRMVSVCLAVQVAATLAFVGAALAGASPWTFAVLILVAVATNGGVLGNSAALAMTGIRQVAGTASAVLGFSQFALGAVVSPLVGVAGESSAVAPALVMAGCSGLAAVVHLLGRGSARPQGSDSTSTATS